MKRTPLYLLLGMFTLACALPAANAQDARAKAAVERLEARYHAARTLKAYFLERYAEGGRTVRTEAGIAYFRRPGRMRWEYDSPEKKLFVSDGKHVWFYVPADRTVTRAKVKESADWRTPLALLAGKAKLSKLCSRIETAGNAATSNGMILRCHPRGEKPSPAKAGAGGEVLSGEDGELIQEILLEVDPASGELRSVRVRQTGGIEIEFRFGNWEENLPLAAGLFEFHPPPGVAIVDERTFSPAGH